MLWAYAVYKYRIDKGITKLKGRTITSARRINPLTGHIRRKFVPISARPKYFDKQTNSRYDQGVPVWDIPFAELKKAYDEARFDRYLKANDPNSNRRFFNRFFKRRIFWLYPKNGKLHTPMPNQILKGYRYPSKMLYYAPYRLLCSRLSLWNQDYRGFKKEVIKE